MRVCSVPGCGTLIEKAGRCDVHRRDAERERGTSTERGYGYDHQRLRTEWQRAIDKGGVRCWRCDEDIPPRQPDAWDLGHDDVDRTRYLGPECIPCNRGTAGRTGGLPPAA